MSDNVKSFLISFGYIFAWVLQAIIFFIIFGVMTLLNSLFEFNQDIWAVSLVVFLIYNVHKTSKRVSKIAVEQTLDEEEKK